MVIPLKQNGQRKRHTLAQAFQILVEFILRFDLPIVALFDFNYREQLLQQRSKFKFAIERERKIISLQRVRQKIETNKEYAVIIYTNRRSSRLWWQSWFVPKVVRVQHKLKNLTSS